MNRFTWKPSDITITKAKDENSYNPYEISTELNGGPGSGNHGHSGRPGVVGGSSSYGLNESTYKFINEVPVTITGENYRAKALFNELGYTGKPKLVDEIAKNETPLYRGIIEEDGNTFKESFIKGDFFVGDGNVGPGAYFTEDSRLAESFSGNGILIKASLQKDAKGIGIGELKAEMKSLRDSGLTDASTNGYFDGFMFAHTEPGVFAALKGYDYIDVPSTPTYGPQTVILNRTKLNVEKSHVDVRNSASKIKNYSPSQPRDSIGRFASGGLSTYSSLEEVYSAYPTMKSTLDQMDSITATYDQNERDRLDEIYLAASAKEKALSDKMRDREKALESEGITDYSTVREDEIYSELKVQQSLAIEESGKAFSTWRDYQIDKEMAKASLKEDLYEATYGDQWQTKYGEAHKTLRSWAENKYSTAKKGMEGDNYGSLELEHAMTQAYYMRKGQTEVEVQWGLYGNTADRIMSGESGVRKGIASVTTSSVIAESYASMSRQTSGTKRYITSGDELPREGVVVTAKVPISRILVSYEIVADTSIFIDPKIMRSGKTSTGVFLRKQDEIIVDVPNKADTSNYRTIETDSTAYDLKEAYDKGNAWSDII